MKITKRHSQNFDVAEERKLLCQIVNCMRIGILSTLLVSIFLGPRKMPIV